MRNRAARRAGIGLAVALACRRRGAARHPRCQTATHRIAARRAAGRARCHTRRGRCCTAWRRGACCLAAPCTRRGTPAGPASRDAGDAHAGSSARTATSSCCGGGRDGAGSVRVRVGRQKRGWAAARACWTGAARGASRGVRKATPVGAEREQHADGCARRGASMPLSILPARSASLVLARSALWHAVCDGADRITGARSCSVAAQGRVSTGLQSRLPARSEDEDFGAVWSATAHTRAGKGHETSTRTPSAFANHEARRQACSGSTRARQLSPAFEEQAARSARRLLAAQSLRSAGDGGRRL